MRKKGFSLIELLLGSAIMLIVLVATLSIYTRSNRTSVDQHQYADLQNNVRSSMYFLAKDIRSAGVGLLPDIAGYFLEGTDAATAAPEAADCIRLMGNFDDPLNLRVEDYSGGEGGGSATAFLYDNAFDQSPYPCPSFYEGRNSLIISTKCPGCFALRYIDKVQGCGTGTNHIIMNPGASDLNPPGGLVDTGCGAECWTDAIITLGQIKLYWLDTTGDLTSFKEFTLTSGVDGYLGQPGVLYLSTTLQDGGITHLPIARNIENIQFQYNGDLDDPPDQQLDGFKNWDNVDWTILDTDTEAQRTAKRDLISRIRQVRMWVVGRTERAYVSVSGRPPAGVSLYRRPAIANSTVVGTDDRHRRFVLESTSNVRNMSLSLYNLGQR